MITVGPLRSLPRRSGWDLNNLTEDLVAREALRVVLFGPSAGRAGRELDLQTLVLGFELVDPLNDRIDLREGSASASLSPWRKGRIVAILINSL